jgi:hypothetical protein
MSKLSSRSLVSGLAIAWLLYPTHPASAHAIAGDRVFPATIAIDDPGVSDEMTLPQISTFKQRNDDGSTSWNTDAAAEYDKRITQDLAISINEDYDHIQGQGSGWDNLGVGLKYQALTNAEHEFMMSVGVDSGIGRTGSQLIGNRHSDFTPALFVGKGFGDLPDSVDWLKPFALTGTAGVDLPADGTDPQALEYGFTMQYSLPYLQQHVKDIGLPKPIDGFVPLVEFAYESPYDRGEHTTTGTINPGVIWMGSTMQVGLEAIVPMNNASGSGVGAVAQVHFFLDDLFPHSIGKPIF